MTTTQTRRIRELTELFAGVRSAIAAQASWSDTAQLVAAELRTYLPSPDVLTAEQRLGSPDGYRSHTLHVEPDGSFSIVALVWRAGQQTRIHDHITWRAFGVIQGVEHRTTGRPQPDRRATTKSARSAVSPCRRHHRATPATPRRSIHLTAPTSHASAECPPLPTEHVRVRGRRAPERRGASRPLGTGAAGDGGIDCGPTDNPPCGHLTPRRPGSRRGRYASRQAHPARSQHRLAA
jgi:predicted metal-dependent enzyme (double-stranded beta helix superfamily)